MSDFSLDQIPSPIEPNILKKLWRGDIPLAKTYWIYGVLVGQIFGLALTPSIIYLIVSNAKSLGSPGVHAASHIWQGIAFLYTGFIDVAIWRSADNYAVANPLKRGNARAAKLFVVFGAIMAVVLMSNNHHVLGSSSAGGQLYTQAALSGLNKDLPRQLDSASTLTKIDIQGQKYIYYITVSSDVPDKEAFKNDISYRLIKRVCKNKDLLDLFKNNYTLEYSYKDKDGQTFTNLDVTKSDCPNF